MISHFLPSSYDGATLNIPVHLTHRVNEKLPTTTPFVYSTEDGSTKSCRLHLDDVVHGIEKWEEIITVEQVNFHNFK